MENNSTLQEFKPDEGFTMPDTDSNFLAPSPTVGGLTLDEVKQYLRVDFTDDDAIITSFLYSADQTCRGILGVTKTKNLENIPNIRTAVLYIVAYQYENRENSDFQAMKRNVRALLGYGRKVGF